jgi:hypothetical protein
MQFTCLIASVPNMGLICGFLARGAMAFHLLAGQWEGVPIGRSLAKADPLFRSRE